MIETTGSEPAKVNADELANGDVMIADCRPTPQPAAEAPKPRKWTTQAGPIQSKKVRDALAKISWEGRTYVELSGVIGGEEHRSCYTQVFGGQSEASIAALEAVAVKFDWTVTRENYAAIIAECECQVAELAKNRPVNDKRETPEQRAETIRLNKERADKREADELARKAAWAEAQKAEQALKAAQTQTASGGTLHFGSGGSVMYNKEHDGVEIVFDTKPERRVLDSCKANGFRWSPRSHVWYKKFSSEAWKAACRIAGVDELPAPASKNTDPAGAYVQAQEEAFADAECARIGA